MSRRFLRAPFSSAVAHLILVRPKSATTHEGAKLTDQFQHVMVLTSIIIGLGITYILIGVGTVIERITGHGAALRLSWAHATWLLTLFVWMVSFWWWEFRLLALLKSWTLAHYFFIITYAVLLFLLAVLLLPRDWAATNSLDDYFLSKRRWFYPLYLIATFADIVDAWLKGGWPYIQANGVSAFVYWAAAIPVCIVGVRSKNIRIHTFMAIVICVLQLIAVFEVFPKLGL
jgi:hypothetical protein